LNGKASEMFKHIEEI